VQAGQRVDTQAEGDRDAARSPSPLVEVEGIEKVFGAVHALKGVSLAIKPGSVHGLIGANGAGKSTLIRCLAGVVRPDAGTVRVDGEPVDVATPSDANELGFAFLHQELNLVQKFNGLDNKIGRAHV